MSWIRNALISVGVYWLSRWVAVLFGWCLDIPLNRFAHVYSENALSAVYMGAIVSRDRTVAAILAGVAVTLLVPSRRSHFWALLVAALYAVDYRMLSYSGLPPTAWDQLCLQVERFFPAVACIVAAFVTAWLRTRRQSATVRRDD